MDISRFRAAAGLLLLLAGSVILLGITTGEAVYPDVYSTHENTISDLGGTRPPEAIVRQPSAAIFNATMIVTGAMIVAAAYLLQRSLRRPVVTVPTGLLGVGILGVGLFPGNTAPHPLVALFTFLSGGVAAALSYRVVAPPLRYVCAALGIVALVALGAGLFLHDWGPVAKLGEGGIERWIAYPVVLWLVAVGGYLTAPRAIGPHGGDLRPSTKMARTRDDGRDLVGGPARGATSGVTEGFTGGAPVNPSPVRGEQTLTGSHFPSGTQIRPVRRSSRTGRRSGRTTSAIPTPP